MSLSSITRALCSLIREHAVTIALLKPKYATVKFGLVQRCSIHLTCAYNGRYSGYKVVEDLKTTEYTTRPLKMVSTGGRGPDGRIETRRLGGGLKRTYLMVDNDRTRILATCGIDEKTLVERVINIQYDDNRSAQIALVAAGETKRYILATTNMKEGDLITTSTDLPLIPVTPKEGNSHPLGALPLGTIVCCIERYPGKGAKVAMSAGTAATIIRKVAGRCIVKMPSKREMNIAEECMCTVGRISNPDHNKEVVGKAGRNRWYGIRPKSGLWHRKTGIHGRKIRPMKPAIIYDVISPPKTDIRVMTFD